MAAPLCRQAPRARLRHVFLEPLKSHSGSPCPHARFLPTAHFTTSPRPAFPRKRDNNKNRGVSAIRSTGLRRRQTIPVTLADLPVPRREEEMPKVETPIDHGLWGFFAPIARQAGRSLRTPDELAAHGNSWSAEQLRLRSWEDLHYLWWACVKERNIIATENRERTRAEAGFGEFEALERDKVVRKTQARIRQVLTERYYAWQDAYELARDDPQVNLSANVDKGERVFTPDVTPSYDEEFEALEADPQPHEQPSDGPSEPPRNDTTTR